MMMIRRWQWCVTAAMLGILWVVLPVTSTWTSMPSGDVGQHDRRQATEGRPGLLAQTAALLAPSSAFAASEGAGALPDRLCPTGAAVAESSGKLKGRRR